MSTDIQVDMKIETLKLEKTHKKLLRINAELSADVERYETEMNGKELKFQSEDCSHCDTKFAVDCSCGYNCVYKICRGCRFERSCTYGVDCCDDTYDDLEPKSDSDSEDENENVSLEALKEKNRDLKEQNERLKERRQAFETYFDTPSSDDDEEECWCYDNGSRKCPRCNRENVYDTCLECRLHDSECWKESQQKKEKDSDSSETESDCGESSSKRTKV